MAENQSDTIVVLLSSKTQVLLETEITAEKYQIFKGKGMDVIDYNFLDTNLLILTFNFSNRHHELILTDEKFDTISIKDIPYLKKPKQIFKDCMGNCHLLTKDSAYQIYIQNEFMDLIYATPLNKFLEILGNCLFQTPTHLAFEGKTDKTQKLEYAACDPYDLPIHRSENEQWKHLFYLVNKETHQKIVLDQNYEWEKNRSAYEHAMVLFNGPENKLFFGDLLRNEEMVFYKPSFQTLKLINDSIYYFNHLESRIDNYSSDLQLYRSINIEYHHKENWLATILLDHIQNKAYTIFTSGMMYAIAEINLQDGSIEESIKIEKLFPKNIKANNGHLYFLYKDFTSALDKRKLYQGDLPRF